MSGAIETGAEIIAALMKGVSTRKGLMQSTGCNEKSIDHWLKGLRASGVIYRERVASVGPGHPPTHYRLQPSPFAVEDRV